MNKIIGLGGKSDPAQGFYPRKEAGNRTKSQRGISRAAHSPWLQVVVLGFFTCLTLFNLKCGEPGNGSPVEQVARGIVVCYLF